MARLAGAGIAGSAAILAACFSTPRFQSSDANDGNADGAKVDATTSIDGMPSSCTFDDFGSDGSGCGSSDWATLSGSGGSGGTSSGVLKLEIFGGSGSRARCQSTLANITRFTANVISAAQDGQGDMTFVGLSDASGLRYGVLFTWDTTTASPGIQVLCGTSFTSTATIPSDLGFVQVAQIGGNVVIYTGLDAKTLTHKLGSCTPAGGLGNTFAYLSLDRTANNTATTPPSLFGSVELCQL